MPQRLISNQYIETDMGTGVKAMQHTHSNHFNRVEYYGQFLWVQKRTPGAILGGGGLVR